MIYFDNSATTKPDNEIVNQFKEIVSKYYANPSSIHHLGGEVDKLQAAARLQVAKLLGIHHKEIIFTSGGTESNNLAIKGVALQHQSRGKHIITTKIEHASVYEACKGLEKLGFEITYLPVDENGEVELAALKRALRADTILVSIMHVNNEIGTIQPIEEIGRILSAYPKALFHVDAVQSLGKVPIDLIDFNIDLCSFSGHKINGLNGTGALYIQEGTQLFPLFHGGGQELNYRSGTENVAGNVAFAKALRKALERLNNNNHMYRVKAALIEQLNELEGVCLNTPQRSAPHIIHFSIPGLKPEVIIHSMYEKGYIISTQSACSSKVSNESRVLKACGKPEGEVISGIRVSINSEHTIENVIDFVNALSDTLKALKIILE